MISAIRYLAIVVALVMIVGGCSTGPPHDRLNVDNDTTLELVIVVNGTEIGSVGPHRLAFFARSDLPSLPWTIEARTRSGRQLLQLPIERELDPSMSTSTGIDLSCGRLDLYFGDKPEAFPGPGTPGDCDA